MDRPLRSLLFVPGDRPERAMKAAASGADAVILDLEDSVAPGAKPAARLAVAEVIARGAPVPLLVRINPLDAGMVAEDVAAARGASALVLPKAEGAPAVRALLAAMAVPLPVLPIATETPAAIFALGSYREVADALFGLSWGAEDLPAAIGASAARDAAGAYLPPYELARSLALFAAHAAGTQAIDTVYPDFRDVDGLADYAGRAARDGFTGMLAIHPLQVPVINAAFTPSGAELDRARAVVAAFAASPGAGALSLDGRMIDAPHLKQAERLLARAAAAAQPAGASPK